MKIPQAFIDYIESNCEVDEIEGNLRCANCGCLVTVDWFEKELTCTGCDEL